ncbi:MAG: PqqD family peptide modification chaperone [Proteobacteria bacterium]|nr:PqqD family peptide modification chaperone [Pseudomonadota bacterium]
MGIHSYLLDNEMLLYSEARQSIYCLNPSASFLWCCYEEGLPEEQMVAELVDAFQINEAQAQRDLAATLSEWQKLGLLGGSPESRSSAGNDGTGVGETDEALIDTVCIGILSGSGVIRYYRILGQVIEIQYSDEALLKTAGMALGSLLVEVTATSQHNFTVARAENGFVIKHGEQLVEHCRAIEELAPLVLAQVISRVYLDTSCLLGLHAAAVGKRGHCIAMPAVSGSGKSTLTAALAASGFDYYTDELVLVMNDSYQLMTAPVGMGIKPGSWPLLSDYYPELETLPVCPRPDGKQVRYLAAPRAICASVDDGNHIRALVFPVYAPGQSACLAPVSTADAICRLTAAGYDVDGGLSRNTVEELIGWIGEQDCYELLFDDLEEAIAIIDGLLA